MQRVNLNERKQGRIFHREKQKMRERERDKKNKESAQASKRGRILLEKQRERGRK